MKRLMRKAVIIGQVVLFAAVGATAWGQELSDVPDEARTGAVERSLDQPSVPAPAKLPDIQIEDEQGRRFKGSADLTFYLKDIVFEGNRVISGPDLKAYVGNYLMQEIAVSTLPEITDAVTRLYKERGYFLSRAYIPPQSIKDTVVIKVREGRLGEIIIEGNKRYSRELIRNTLKIIRGEGAVRTADVERGLLLLTDYPGLQVKATFKPGERPGLTDLVLTVMEDRIVKVGVDFNNYGSQYVSRERVGVSLAVNNPFGLGEALNIRLVGWDGSTLGYGRAEYSMPLDARGARIGLWYSQLNYELTEELDPFDFSGDQRAGGVWVSKPFIRTRNLNWWGDAAFDLKNVNEKIFGQEVGSDDIRFVHAGTAVQVRDTLLNGMGATTTVGLRGYQGLADVLGGAASTDQTEIRHNRVVAFNKATVDVARIQALPFGFSMLVNYHHQFASDRLPSTEMISIGGAGTVRGYAASEYSGDKGGYGTAELRIPFLGLTHLRWGGDPRAKTVGETIQLAAFVDYGQVDVNDTLIGEDTLNDSKDIWGAGVGLRFTYNPWVRLKVDWAKSIGGEDPKDIDDNDNGIWTFQGSVLF